MTNRAKTSVACFFSLFSAVLLWASTVSISGPRITVFQDVNKTGVGTKPNGTQTKRPWTSPKPNSTAEFGHGLTRAEADQGWISLFDGKTTFGWKGGVVKNGSLSGPAITTTAFAHYELRGEADRTGSIRIGEKTYQVKRGLFRYRIQLAKVSRIEISKGVILSRMELRPLGLKSVLNGKDLEGWRILKHPRNPKARATWSIKDGIVRAVGGPGALELQQKHGDVVLQMQVRTGKLSNGGLFFRAIPGDFMNGYEAQIFNACYDHDPAQPVRYSTGAIDDRQLARRLVSRDGQWFTMTVIARGQHIATWVNGYQQVDWTDTRSPHENPRKGLRIAPGTIQIQAHDPQTDFEFRNVKIRPTRNP